MHLTGVIPAEDFTQTWAAGKQPQKIMGQRLCHQKHPLIRIAARVWC